MSAVPNPLKLLVVQGNDHPALLKDSLATGELYWVDGRPPLDAIECAAKTRYRQPDQPCRLIPQKRGCRVEFARTQRAITLG